MPKSPKQKKKKFKYEVTLVWNCEQFKDLTIVKIETENETHWLTYLELRYKERIITSHLVPACDYHSSFRKMMSFAEGYERAMIDVLMNKW
jgi:hypothetical protein